jgi:HEAT repeats
MAHRHIEKEIERLNLLREVPREEAIKALRKALGDRVNLMAAKAARIAADLQLRDLLPDLLRTFDRLFERPVENDAQCWGKNAIAKALIEMDHRESAPFLRGMRHVQMEPSYGGLVDTAPTLRGICLLALAPCVDLTRQEILRYLVDGLTDRAHTVRIEAVRGLEVMEGESTLLLRLKARLGDEEPAVIGQVFDSLLALEKERGIPFVAEFLKADLDIRGEAALALGSSRLPEAVSVLRETWNSAREGDFRQILLRALSISRQESAIQFLVEVVKSGRSHDSQAALQALALHDSPEIRRMAAEAAEYHRKERMEA